MNQMENVILHKENEVIDRWPISIVKEKNYIAKEFSARIKENDSYSDKLFYSICREETPTYRTYKDRVFRLLFSDKENLLELYNALCGTEYTDSDELTVTTLENAVFINMKNDLSFIVDCNMCLYEHQSTYCPNMPLRGFLYFSDLYKKILKDVDLSVWHLIKIPTPHYIVFYNGPEKREEEFVQRLSDAFKDGGQGCMELTVRVININFGHNKELMDKCRSLYGYAYFVAKVRKNLKIMELKRAVLLAVEECIAKDILRDFFTEQKAEVIAMSIYEYNEEYVRKVYMEDGETVGVSKGERRFGKLIEKMLLDNKQDEIILVTGNEVLRKEYYQRYHILE